jgi:hypothetical protein
MNPYLWRKEEGGGRRKEVEGVRSKGMWVRGEMIFLNDQNKRDFSHHSCATTSTQ